MTEPRRRYTEEFKQEALQQAERGDKTLTQVAHELGVHRDLLQRWKREVSEEGQKAFPGSGHPRDEELSRLRKETAEMLEGREILKKRWLFFRE